METGLNKKNILNKILTHLMKVHKIDDRMLAKYTGIAVGNISRLRINPNANPTTATLIPIAKFFNVTIGQLVGEESLNETTTANFINYNQSNIINIPLLNWNELIGFTQGSLKINIDTIYRWIPTEKIENSNYFAVQLDLNSFGLVIRKGSILVVDPNKNLTNGELAILNFKDEITIKKIIKDGDDIYLKSIDIDIKSIRPILSDDIYIGTIIEVRYSPRDVL